MKNKKKRESIAGPCGTSPSAALPHQIRYCKGAQAAKEWKSASYLRQHVKRSHARQGRDHAAVYVVHKQKGSGKTMRAPRGFNSGGEEAQGPEVSVPARMRRPMPVAKNVPPPLVISDNDLAIMKDIHAQLHLRHGVSDPFFLLVWHHILRSKIPDLENICRIVTPRMVGIPGAVVRIINSFLAEYGALMWPVGTRSHLSKTSRLSVAGHWTRGPVSEPYQNIHDGMSNLQQNAFRRHSGREPNDVEVTFYSSLGQLLKVYVFAALHRSLVDDGYTRAVTAGPKLSLHMILVEYEDERTEPLVRMKPYANGSGPLVDALREERGRPWKSEAALLSSAQTLLRKTGGLGGLSVAENRSEEDLSEEGQVVQVVDSEQMVDIE